MCPRHCHFVALLITALLTASSIVTAAPTPSDAIDWDRARGLMKKYQAGQSLTEDEKVYLDRARAARRNQPRTAPARADEATSTGLVPLTQMTAADRYKGEDGGLYGGGANEPPEAHRRLAAQEAARIEPLDTEGKPSPDGRIVLLSIGMSNTTQEFSRFKELADADPAKSPRVLIVDAAQGGQDAKKWADPNGRTWTVLDERLKAAGVTARQVQAIWMKHALINPGSLGAFPAHARKLQEGVQESLRLARERFPNLRVVFLSSRLYAGYAATALNPEPYAYESAFAVRWVIQDQMKDGAKPNAPEAKGPRQGPALLWGPYLWADGLSPRKSDGLIWTRADLAADGTHSSRDAGREKVGQLLLNFFKTSLFAKGWFLK